MTLTDTLMFSASTTDVVDRYAHELTVTTGLRHFVGDQWPAHPDTDIRTPGRGLPAPASSQVGGGAREALSMLEGDVLQLRQYGGMIWARAYAKDTAGAHSVLRAARAAFPPVKGDDDGFAQIAFWTYSQHGPRRVTRRIDTEQWSAIAPNYPAAVGLGELLTAFSPGHGGQLVLWHGEPGTGKTTALRALAHEWKAWCDLHYIIDPEKFFGHAADYMMDVILTDEDGDAQPAVPGAPDQPADKLERWRLLVLEDFGEMLQPDSREKVGQALSRVLNVCDGLIGRGLRILLLVTTNEPLGKLHEAVARPGRCAAQIEFKAFDREAAKAWLDGYDVTVPPLLSHPTLADLYGLIEGFHGRKDRPPIGFQAAAA